MILTVKAEGYAAKSVTVSLASHKPATGTTLGYCFGRSWWDAGKLGYKPTIGYSAVFFGHSLNLSLDPPSPVSV